MSKSDDDTGLRCPQCGCRHVPEEPGSKVAQTFARGPRQSIRRRRVCRACGKRFSTYERVAG